MSECMMLDEVCACISQEDHNWCVRQDNVIKSKEGDALGLTGQIQL